MSPPPITTPVTKSKHRLIIGILLGIVALGGVASLLMSDAKPHRKAAPKEQTVTIVLPPPPVVTPPPPPPKVDTPPPKEEEMVEQQPVPDNEPPPEAAPEAPPAENFGGNPGGAGPPGGTGGGNGKPGGTGRIGGGSKFGWYAAKVQTTIAQALRSNASTRSATLSLQVRVWADTDGRITRATLVGSSGNPATDTAIKNQVLTGLQLPQAPPADMPMPITLRITARKPAI